MECINEMKDSLNVYFGWNKVDLALKTGSHCNRMYADTFSTLFKKY